MGLLTHARDAAAVAPFWYFPAAAIELEPGMALQLTDGLLQMATGTDKPTHICQYYSGGEAVEEGTIVAVTRVLDDVVFETTSSVDMSTVNIGDRVTIAADGLRVTATTGGYAEVLYIEDTDAGGAVRVRFSAE